jgi:hypothetical protein
LWTPGFLDTLNLVFGFIFLIEMFMKVFALGWG